MAALLRPVGVERLARLLEAGVRRSGGPCGMPLGLSRELFFKPVPDQPFRFPVGQGTLDTPVGVAAGPHTQMAQGIVACWLMGARTIELKTVQARDDIEVTRPCIRVEDHGYNCEWSQELPLEQSLAEYSAAWALVHVLRRALGHASALPGLAFVMSVGYDYAGIQGPRMQRFLDGMTDAGPWLERAMSALAGVFPEARALSLPARISREATLSTMHGCPPDEVERIGLALIEGRGLDTTIKLNPTLLGPHEVRRIVGSVLGRSASIPDEAFQHDLQYDQALRVIETLSAAAARRGVRFGVKLTNTLETSNDAGLLPIAEPRIYMSGGPLHPLAVRLALRLRRDVGAGLPVSFSAGADCWSVPDLLACGLAPVTVCTDLLKPGGSLRLLQYLQELRGRMAEAGAGSLREWTLRWPPGRDPKRRDATAAALENLERYGERVLEGDAWRARPASRRHTLKTARPLPAFDCVQAPCEQTCPAGQEVADYMAYAARRDAAAALAVVRRSNPLPLVTGRICDHPCEAHCTRLAYDASLRIRDIKGFVACEGRSCERRAGGSADWDAATPGRRVAVIGGGPSGIACASLLAEAGVHVTVYDEGRAPGGLPRRLIPRFRLSDGDVDADVASLVGVRFAPPVRVDRALFAKLRREHDAVYVAVGAWGDRKLGIPGEDLPGVLVAADLLERARAGGALDIGPRVAVVGGGNSAVDSARVALRLAGPGARVTVLYRRSRTEIPADQEELEAAEKEGVELRELVAPVALQAAGGAIRIVLQTMRPGPRGPDGRAQAMPVAGSVTIADFDTVITAVGQEPVLDFAAADGLLVDAAQGTTSDPKVFVGGDAARGPSTVITAIADGRSAARRVLRRIGSSGAPAPLPRVAKYASVSEQQKRAALRVLAGSDALSPDAAAAEASRCLYCDEICNLCVSVCPNRANLFWEGRPRTLRIQVADPAGAGGSTGEGGAPLVRDDGFLQAEQRVQVFNIVDWCNECGACTWFCPSSGSPFRDKPRVCLSDETYAATPGAYRLFRSGARVGVRVRGATSEARLVPRGSEWLYDEGDLHATLDGETLAVRRVQLAGGSWSTRGAALMALLASELGATPLGAWLAGG